MKNRLSCTRSVTVMRRSICSLSSLMAYALSAWSAASILPPVEAHAQKVHQLPANPSTVAYGYYWSLAKPVLTIASGDIVEIETMLTNTPQGLERMGVKPEDVPQNLRDIVAQVAGDQVAHLAAALGIALPDPVHRQQARLQGRRALALAQAFPDDHIDAARFVLQGDEHHAFGGAGLLAHGHQAAGAHQPAIGQAVQLGGGHEFHF